MPRMTPSEAFVETLAANGVTDVFGVVASALMDALDPFVTWISIERAYKRALHF